MAKSTNNTISSNKKKTTPPRDDKKKPPPLPEFRSPKKVKRSSVPKPRGNSVTFVDTFYIETCGVDGEYLIMNATQRNGNEAYTMPLLYDTDQEPKQKRIDDSIANEDTFDVRTSNTLLYLRKSPDTDVAIEKNNFRLKAIASLPDKHTLFEMNSHLETFNYLTFEKLFRDACEEGMMRYHKKKYKENLAKGKDFKTIYAAWDPTIHSKTVPGKYRSLDHVLTDNSVAQLLLCYHGVPGEDNEIFKTLEFPNSYFTRDKNGKYSVIAQSFGYPSDTVP